MPKAKPPPEDDPEKSVTAKGKLSSWYASLSDRWRSGLIAVIAIMASMAVAWGVSTAYPAKSDNSHVESEIPAPPNDADESGKGYATPSLTKSPYVEPINEIIVDLHEEPYATRQCKLVKLVEVEGNCNDFPDSAAMSY